jgi:hypothetical protein
MFISVECTHTFNVPRCSRFGSPFSCVSLLRAACVKVRGFICGSICAARVFFRADSGGRGRPSRGVAPPIRAAFSYFGGFLWRPCRTHTHTHTRVHTYTHTHTHTHTGRAPAQQKEGQEREPFYGRRLLLLPARPDGHCGWIYLGPSVHDLSRRGAQRCAPSNTSATR